MSARSRKWLLFSLAGFLVLLLITGIAVVALLRSTWFHDAVRDRIIAEAAKATGGRAEIGRFEFDWRTLEARVAPFTLHGKEKPGEPVFLQTDGIRVKLRIVSALQKNVNIAALVVERPRIHIVEYADGTNNIPTPKTRAQGTNVVDRLFQIAIRHFEIHNGLVEVRNAKLPFDIRGDDLTAVLDYDRAGPRYRGHVSSRQLHFQARNVNPLAFDFDTDLTADKNQLAFTNTSFLAGRTKVQASGSMNTRGSPEVHFQFEAAMPVAELRQAVKVPVESAGDVSARGTGLLNWKNGFEYRIDGRFTGRGLAYRDPRIHVAGIAASGEFHLEPGAVSLPRLTATALGGTFDGHMDLTQGFERLRIEGSARGVGLNELTRVSGRPDIAWSGVASGPVRIDGIVGGKGGRDFTVQANMNIEPAEGGIPVRGNVDLIFDQTAHSLRLGQSEISTLSSRVQASGTLGESMRVSLATRNLDDLLPAIAMASPGALQEFPLKLASTGNADVEVRGPLQNPVIAGRVKLGKFEAQGQNFDSLSADVTVSQGELTARNLNLAQGPMRVSGGGHVQLQNWKIVDTSAVAAALQLSGGDVQHLLAQAGRKEPVHGTLGASADITGTYAAPDASVRFTIDNPSAYGEVFTQLRGEGRVTSREMVLNTGELRAGRGRAKFSGAYRRTGAAWKTGTINFQLSATGFSLDQFKRIRDYDTDIAAGLSLNATGAAHTTNGSFDLDALDSGLELAGITRGAAAVGNLTATAKTRGDLLEAGIRGALRGSNVQGSGQWKLEGDYPGRGEIQFTPVTFAALHQLATKGAVDRQLPFAGTIDGRAVITGPLKKPKELRADVILNRVQMSPAPDQRLRAGVKGQDLVLRNVGPVTFTAALDSVKIESARFAATDTSLDAVGRVAFNQQSPWDVQVRGRMNLAILQLFNSDLLARGNAVLDTRIQGPLADPQVSGRLELQQASLYLGDLPAGIDNANGAVTFDRNRANIETLTAEVGGGRVGFGGFIGFSSGLLLYRVQANADQVRIRHPEGISVTINALLNLTGTSQNGLISGTVTVMRAGFEPRTDLGGLLAASAKPLPAPAAPNEYLRGLNFDVRIESGPSLEVQTSLTRDVQAEAELRLRGNAARPILLGDISVNQGQIQFFGNKYTINRGDIRFINPTKIDPVVDIDVETKARGITVNISFSGTLNKLNLTYRSDPPLQTNDIIALLAVGRDPTTSAFANAQTRTNLLQSSANTLGQAVAAPVSSRLQRFFGVSRLKIDPQLTGVENIPQARLTLEQQVSRDITLTYITNLARTQEQIVRIQWDINREWSAIAVREENGVFGIDFQYRKRFK